MSDDKSCDRYGILVVGHGSKLPYNKELVEGVAGALAEIYKNAVVRVGFMCQNGPTVTEALESFRKDGVDKVVVAPLFLEKGVHILEDIPALIGLKNGESSASHNGLSVVYAAPLGADDLLVSLVCKRIHEATGM